MDTRAPPIAPRTQQQQQQDRCQQQQATTTTESEEVTLPPLANQQPQQRHRTKSTTANNWRNNNGPPPGLLKQQDIQRRRPYKVLAIGATPLMHACQQADRARVLKLLRDQEETIGYRDRALRSALHYCMDASTGGAVAQAAPELVDAPDGEGHTPLHLAVIAGDTQLVAVLLANGADVNAKDLEGHSVLHWATVCGEVECVRLVLAAGARPSAADHRGGSALHYAAQCCGAAATAELAVPKKVGLKVLQTLLEFGADVNARDEDGRQPILWAASAGSVEAILALVRAGGSAVSNASDKDGLTALHCAASRGHARCIETLVNLCDAQPDHVDDNGCSALHYAATLGHADATALLLKLGADPNRQDRKGRTPALCAAAKGQLETLKILSQHGGSLHARTVRGTGVAHEAVASGRLELVKWLIKRKPSLLDVATQDGKTPLHVAALHGHLDACKLLLDSGARINALLRTSKGAVMTALDAALYRGHRDCAKLIQMHGGFTAQHLSTHKSLASNKVFSSKLRVRHTESSSDSELNSVTPRSLQQRQHHRNRDPDMYYEERWVERRTRRRANRRRLSRQDSRSYSEEELRHHSKASTTVKSTERQRRALSENARYDEAERDLDDDLDDEDHQRRGSRRRKDDKHFKRKKSGKTTGESAASGGGGESESEDSSESSTKSDEEGSSVSDDSLEVVIVKRCLEKTSEKIISGRKSKTPRDDSKSSKTSEEKSKSSSKKDQQDHKSKRDKSPPTAKPRKLSGQAQQQEEKAFDGDSTSQDTVEQVTVTVDVHKTGPPLIRQSEAGETTATEQEMDEQMKSKMEDILEKADELQSALLTKAADLKKDVEEMRHQMAQKSESDDKKECSGDTKSYTTTTTSTGTFESTESSSAKEETPNLEAKRKSLDQQQQQQQPSQEAPIAKPETTTTDSDQVEIKTTEVTDQDGKSSITVEVTETKRGSLVSKTQIEQTETKQDTAEVKESKAEQEPPKKNDKPELQTQSSTAVTESSIPGAEALRFADESSSSSPAPGKLGKRARPTTGKRRGLAKPNISTTSGTKSSTILFESSTEERSPDRSAIVAVIESPEWDEEDDEEIDKEIRDVVGDGVEEHDEEEDDLEEESDGGEDDGGGIVRVLPSSEDDILGARNNGIDALPQLQPKGHRLVRVSGGHQDCRFGRHQRHDSGGGGGGRDSGIEPSPRVSRIPKRQLRCCPNTERQQALHMDTITRDVQISLRRYHLERKIFFQLMELKRLQIRNGRSNEQVLVKRQVDAFNRAGMSGPALGVSKYDQPYTFRAFETFLYEQLRRLQKRPATPDFCTEARQCTQRTHRCHHATSAYTSVPIYTYLGGGGQERPQSILPRIEGRGKGHMTVELTHGQEKQVIALPSEKLDRTKRYYVTFTVRGETADSDKSDKVPLSSAQLRQAKSI